MNDDPIFGALRRLPRAAASPGFTQRAMARAAGSESASTSTAGSESGLGWSRGWAMFASCLALVSIVSAWQWERRERKREWLGEVQALREASRSLEGDLDALRAAEMAPVVHLGGDDSVDLILDLEAVRQARGVQARTLARTEASAARAVDERPVPNPTTQGDTL
jgi:hypothetical protein